MGSMQVFGKSSRSPPFFVLQYMCVEYVEGEGVLCLLWDFRKRKEGLKDSSCLIMVDCGGAEK